MGRHTPDHGRGHERGLVVPVAAIRVSGAKELRAALKEANDRELNRALRDAHEASAQIVIDAALPNIPVRSGRLRGSAEPKGTLAGGSALLDTEYAGAVHWGRKTGNVGSPPGNHPGPNVIQGRPVVWEAAQAKTPEITAQFEQEMDALCAEVERRAL